MQKFMTKKSKGQGVIEYAGALVIAGVLVSAVLLVGPDGMANTFDSIIDAVGSYFQGQVDNLGS
jgi:hypothetical protein